MRIKLVVLAVLGVLLAASAAEAQVLSIATARKEIRRDAVENCKKACIEIEVNQCTRRSPRRVSCHARAEFRDESECLWQAIAILKAGSSKVRIRIRNEVCGPV